MQRISTKNQDIGFTWDVIIIGSGLFGLSTGISLLEQTPTLKVVILERGLLPTGATTKNGGFGMIVGYTEFLDEVKHHSLSEAVNTFFHRLQGLQTLLRRLHFDPEIIHHTGCYDAISQEELASLDQLEKVNLALKPHFGEKPFFELRPQKIAEFGLNPNLTKSLVYHDYHFGVHSGKAVDRLTQIFNQLGGKILTGVNVTNFSENAQRVRLEFGVSPTSKTGQSGFFLAKQAVFCVNSFQRFAQPENIIKPGRGQVMITKPIKNLRFSANLLFELSFYYLRVVDDRILIGGGRNLDFQGEHTNQMHTTQFYRNHLAEKLRQIFPELEFEPDYFWAGIMGFDDKIFRIDKIGKNVFNVFGCNGIGMAMGSYVGNLAAEKISKEIN